MTHLLSYVGNLSVLVTLVTVLFFFRWYFSWFRTILINIALDHNKFLRDLATQNCSLSCVNIILLRINRSEIFLEILFQRISVHSMQWLVPKIKPCSYEKRWNEKTIKEEKINKRKQKSIVQFRQKECIEIWQIICGMWWKSACFHLILRFYLRTIYLCT